MRIVLTLALATAGCFGQTFGTWEIDAARSTFAGDTQPKDLTVRIERHVKGEVFTVDRTEFNGQVNSFSTLLYLDGVPRDFQAGRCSGTQSSRRVDSQTVEILRNCGSGAWIRFVRKTSTNPRELVFEISEQHAGGRRFERRLVLEKKWEGR
jgi:hypothetical protein